VVCSDIEGIRDIIQDGQNGILIDTEDASRLANAIVRLCVNPHEAILMGKKGGETVCSSFVLSAEMEKIKKMYNQCLQGK
jgi:glycosyltransferase involved in cell wall biosynthesis